MTPVAILAGGEGTRMGGRKPERLLAGRPLIKRVLDRARLWGGPTAVVLRRADQWSSPSPGVHLIHDDPTQEGPVAGLAAALDWATALGCDRVLVVACDTPFLPEDLAQRLDDALCPDAGVAMAATPGRLHPSCALWRSSNRAAIAAEAAEGRRSLRGVALRAHPAIVEWPCAEAAAFANINTPDELASAEAWLETTSKG